MINQLLTTAQTEKINEYYRLLLDWNKQHNLTRITKIEDFIEKNILDTVAVVSYIKNLPVTHIVDVGTGAGIPGVILAIILPQFQWHLVDSSLKRITFLEEVKHSLSLNITPYHCRVEQFHTQINEPIDLIISRAVSDPVTMLKLTQALHHPDLLIYLMRASKWELSLSTNDWATEEIPLNIPKSTLTRILMILYQKGGTPPHFSIE